MIHFYRPKTGQGLAKRISYWLKHLYYKFVFKGDYSYYLDKHYQRITQYDSEDTGWVGESVIPPLGRQLWRSEWVRETITVPFEMLRVPVPIHFEECLTASFGPDWRTPKQIPNLHSGVFFDTNKPYTEYLTEE
jgi:phosphorylcholine metabolism protein LicD